MVAPHSWVWDNLLYTMLPDPFCVCIGGWVTRQGPNSYVPINVHLHYPPPGLPMVRPRDLTSPTSLAAPPLHKEDGSGTALLLELFCSPEILSNMNMQILQLQYDRDMQVRTTAVLTWHTSRDSHITCCMLSKVPIMLCSDSQHQANYAHHFVPIVLIIISYYFADLIRDNSFGNLLL